MIDVMSLFNDKRLFIIAGPCVIENEGVMFKAAGQLKDITQQLGLPFVFKTSFYKANRTSVGSYRGPGVEEGLSLIREIKQEFNFAVTTDVHTPQQVEKVSEVVDIIQIPALLCRQTDLLLEAGRAGKVVNVKKGKFLAPEDMK